MSSTSDINDIPQLNVVYLLTHKSCRICLREEGNNVFLGNKFEVNIPGRPYERITVKEALKVLFPLVEEQKADSNRFPAAVCSECFIRVKGSYQLKIDYEFASATLTRLIDTEIENPHENKQYEDIESSDIMEISSPLENETLSSDKSNSRKSDTPAKRTAKTKTIHKPRDFSKDLIICEICSKSFHRICNYRTHKETHRERTIKCDFCDQMFNLERNKKKHMKNIHLPKTLINCKICDNKFSSKISLQAHIKSIHLNIKNHKCLICDKSFASKYNFEQHMRVHTGEKKFKCDQCGKAFKENSRLKLHKLIHRDSLLRKSSNRGETRCYKCEFCTKTFPYFNHYVSHYKEYHPNEIIKIPHFKCDECDILFRQQKFYINHMKIHTDGIKYECKICNKEFRTIFHLKFHKHKNPNECKYCNEQFSKLKLLMEHMRSVHAEKFIYSCDICDKRFDLPNTLQKHKFIHTGLKPFKCRYCERAFSVRDNCRTHEKIHENKGEQIIEMSLPLITETQIESESLVFNEDDIIEYNPIYDDPYHEEIVELEIQM